MVLLILGLLSMSACSKDLADSTQAGNAGRIHPGLSDMAKAPAAKPRADATDEQPIGEKEAIGTLITALRQSGRGGWMAPVLRTGEVRPKNWAKGPGVHIQMQPVGPDGKPAARGVEIWIMDEGYTAKKAQWFGAAGELRRWHGRRVFLAAEGAESWRGWRQSVVGALAYSRPEAVRRLRRLDAALKALAGAVDWRRTSIVRNVPYITGPNVHVILPFSMTGPERSMALGWLIDRQFPYEVVGWNEEITVALVLPGREPARCAATSAAVVEALGLTRADGKVVARAKGEQLKANIDRFSMSLTRYDWYGRAAGKALLSVRPYGPRIPPEMITVCLSEQQARKVVDLLVRDGHFDEAVGEGHILRPTIPQVMMSIWGGPEVRPGTPAAQWYLALGWDLSTLGRLERLAGLLDGEAHKDMRRFLAPIAAHRAEWQAEAKAGTAIDPKIRGLIDAVACNTGVQMWSESTPPVPVSVKAGVEAELKNNLGLRKAYEALAVYQRRPDKITIARLIDAKAVWCLATGLCNHSARIECARALAKVKDPRPARFVLDVARANAVPRRGGRRESLRGIFLRELGAALDAMLGTSVMPKEPARVFVEPWKRLRNGIDVWEKAIRKRESVAKSKSVGVRPGSSGDATATPGTSSGTLAYLEGLTELRMLDLDKTQLTDGVWPI